MEKLVRVVIYFVIGGAALSLGARQKDWNSAANEKKIESEPQQKPLTLRKTETVTLKELGGLLVMPLRCDSDGNVFFRRYTIDSPHSSPIIKVSPSGETLASYSLSASGDRNLRGLDFALDSNGRVYQLVYDGEDPARGYDRWILSYSQDGQKKDLVKLDARFSTDGNFAVFPSGEFLVATTEEQEQNKPGLSSKPYTAVFSSDGKLVARVTDESDEKIAKLAEKGEASYASSRGYGGNLAVTYGAVFPGSDGNMYVLRRTSPATIIVISPAGKVVRTFKVDSGLGLFPARMQVAEGRLAIYFKNPGVDAPETIMKVVDLEGNPLETYQVDPELGTAFICYVPPQFTFLTEKNNQRILLRAEPAP